ncbi:MAG: nucleotidyltransferase domain-containing protein [Acidimicrobiia bacterium]|nr:nucleotidyltransferase domain-containing protein [Acidimicrobiia bacterium]
MHDPLEGRTADGMITTGVGLERVPEIYREVLDAAIDAVATHGASLYLYGSVATGRADPPRSDVDLLTIGLTPETASSLSDTLSARFSALARRVEIAPAAASDFAGGGDPAYGGRIFLHHYCAHLTGEDHDRATEPFPADTRAARGLNGDIGIALDGWRSRLADPGGTVDGRRVARKTLLAVAGLVSVHDRTWTTDRLGSASRWAELQPSLAADLALLAAWSERDDQGDDAAVEHMVIEVVPEIVSAFAEEIGLWG